MSSTTTTDALRRRARWWVLAVALLVVGVACIGAAVLNGPSGVEGAGAPPASPTGQSPATAASSSATPTITGRPAPSRTPGSPGSPGASGVHGSPAPLVDSDPPAHLSIPAIGVSEPLLRLGLRPDRTVEVPAPSDAAYPGWFKLGPTPGQLGSSVILGHVDSLRGPAVFYRLRSLVTGNHVDVRLDSGVVAHFEVQKVVTYPNEDFPARKVYGSHSYPALNLVTCGGAYDRNNGGYQSNVVAYTRLVGTSPTGRTNAAAR